MKIAITSRLFYPLLGGTIQYAVMLGTEFLRQGHEVRLLTRMPDDAGDSPELPFEVLRCPDQRQLWRMAKWADVVLQVEASFKDVWPFLLLGKPWFPSLHVGFSEEGLPWLQAFLYRCKRQLLRLGHPVGVSRFVADSWGGYGFFVLNPYDPAVFFPGKDWAAREVDILYVGRVTEVKGVFVLLEAVKALARSEGEKMRRVVFVGEGDGAAELERRVWEAGLTGVVEMVGKRAPHDVAAWMRNARVLAFPTTPLWLEASPLTLLEGLASGCEVVASDIGGVAETGGGFLRLVEAGKVRSLEEGLRQALAGERMPREGLEAFLEQQTLSNVAARYVTEMQRRGGRRRHMN